MEDNNQIVDVTEEFEAAAEAAQDDTQLDDNDADSTTSSSSTASSEGEDEGDGEDEEEEFHVSDDSEDDDDDGDDAAQVDDKNTEDMFVEMDDDEFQTRLKESLALKDKGNTLFKDKDYIAALDLYTQAIDNCCVRRPEVAAFFNNRAACHFQLEDYENCAQDCSHAIELKPPYVKAVSRRAQAYEQLEKLEDALQDYEEVLKHDPGNKPARQAAKRLPAQIKEQQEKMKEEMFAKLKDLGNMCLRPFGLSTDNFKMVQDPSTGSYSVNFVSNGDKSSS